MKSIIIRPIITEKSMKLAKSGQFTFEVAKDTTKELIKKVVEKLFNVHVARISIVITKGRIHKTGLKRIEIGMTDIKKAIVSVRTGEKIDLFETQV